MAPQLAHISSVLSQILLGPPPPYAVDVTAQVPMVPAPAAILSPPLPEVLPPATPELLPQLPSSLAPTVMAATQSLPVQTTALPPASLPLTSGPGISSLCPAVQLTVELAPEVCGLGPQHTPQYLAPVLGLSPEVGKVEACVRLVSLCCPQGHTFLKCVSR